MTPLDFISQMGGLLGLFLGFSLISGIEIIYWFTVKLANRLCCEQSAKVLLGSEGLENKVNLSDFK